MKEVRAGGERSPGRDASCLRPRPILEDGITGRQPAARIRRRIRNAGREPFRRPRLGLVGERSSLKQGVRLCPAALVRGGVGPCGAPPPVAGAGAPQVPQPRHWRAVVKQAREWHCGKAGEPACPLVWTGVGSRCLQYLWWCQPGKSSGSQPGPRFRPLVLPAGLEPASCRCESRRSRHLAYGSI